MTMKIIWNKMTKTIQVTFLTVVFLIGGVRTIAAKEAPLGSPDFSPSPEHPVGWRGDGNGKYPGATPPVHWERTCKQTAALKCSSAIPTNQSSDKAVSTGGGFFTEWLVAGPISCAGKTNAITEELVPGEGALSAQEGDKIAGTLWRKIAVEDSFVDVWKNLDGMTNGQAAFVQTCLYTEKPVKIWFHLKYGAGLAFWFNGVFKYKGTSHYDYMASGPAIALDLQAGWNRFLFKILPRVSAATDFPSCCYVRCRFWPAEEPRDYDEKNIAWITVMPGLSEDTPVIAGDRIFTMAWPYNLVCLDKKTGKILWIRSNSPYDAATAEERKANPDLFSKMDELAAKRDAYYRDFIAGKITSGQPVMEENDVETEIDKLMVQVDRKYKKSTQQGEPEWWTIPTPTTDSKRVCVWLTRGVSASYDLDGKRLWINFEETIEQHHGYFCSPVMAGGKFIKFDGRLTALDVATGRVAWSVDDRNGAGKGSDLWFGSLNRGGVFGGEEYILGPEPALLVRVADGKTSGKFGRGDSTPVLDGDLLFYAYQGDQVGSWRVAPVAGGVAEVKPLKGAAWPLQTMVGSPNFYQGHYLEVSPLIYEGLGYVVSCSGVLAVFDVATMERVYEKALPLDLLHAALTSTSQHGYFGANPALAGQYIYLMGSTGVTLVIKPGRKYEEVARNRIQYLDQVNFTWDGKAQKPLKGRTLGIYKNFYCPEYQDSTMTSTPIFDGRRMYFRGQQNLYCIEEK